MPLPIASLSQIWQDGIIDSGKLPEFLMLAAFLVSWGFIRLSTHMIRAQVSWWPGNISVKGTHVHHLVFGIVTTLIVGYLVIAFEPGSPWRELLAVAFGIGMGLTLDEFALWLELRDVYWLPEGRKSIDAVIVTAAVGLLLLAGVRVWIDLAHDAGGLAKAIVGGSAAIGFLLALANALRGHYLTALATLVVPLAGVAGLVLLRPRPRSIWARVWQHEAPLVSGAWKDHRHGVPPADDDVAGARPGGGGRPG